MSKIVGVGWNKTGTTTLGNALSILGYKHASQKLSLTFDYENQNLSKINHIVEENDSFANWPWALLYKEIDEKYPGSKFILTCREHSSWVKSYKNMLRSQGVASNQLNKIRSILYELPFPDVTEEQLINRYSRHIAEVQEYFKDRPDDLLIVSWRKGHGWKELCEFLGKVIPNQEFPHANIGDYTKIKPNNHLIKRFKKIFVS